MDDPLRFLAVALAGLSALTLLLSKDWRVNIGALALLYVAVFALTLTHWPLSMAVVKLIAGWMSAAVLGMAMSSEAPPAAPPIVPGDPLPLEPVAPPARRSRLGSEALFHLLAALLVGLAVASAAPQLLDWAPEIGQEPAWGGLLLMGMGLLQLGFAARPLPTILGLLTTLAGFESLYAGLESSTLVAGLLAAINLGLALAGAYLIVAPASESETNE